MEAHLIEAFHIPGIIGLPDDAAEISIWKSGYASAVLTKNIDTHLELADRVAAAGHGILTGLFSPSKGTPADQIAATVDDIRTERKKSFDRGVFLVVQSTEPVEAFDFSKANDAGDFLVGLELADTPAMKQIFSKLAQTCVAAVSLLSVDATDPRIKKVASAVYFTDASVAKPIFSFTLQFGGASLYSATAIEPSAISEAQAIIDAMSSDKGMEKVADLYVLSLLQSSDSFRAFLSAWTSLEMLIHQAFKSSYSPQFFKHLEDSCHPSASGYFQRVKDVMSDKHRLLDKFTIMATLLVPADAAADLSQVAVLKKVRDDIVHTAAAGTQYPAADTQRLLRKYLRLHLESADRK